MISAVDVGIMATIAWVVMLIIARMLGYLPSSGIEHPVTWDRRSWDPSETQDHMIHRHDHDRPHDHDF